MDLPLALKVHDLDNVATLFSSNANDRVVVRDKIGNTKQLAIIEKIPYGHKVALCAIKAGQPIIKYGEEIGLASQDIKIGAHVHAHNLASQRGRGDLQHNKG